MDRTSEAPWEHVADILPSGYTPPLRDMNDKDQALQRVGQYLERRLLTILEGNPGMPVLMLSGGIDSVLLAAALRKIDSSPLCVTVSAKDQDSSDRIRAVRVSEQLGLDHLALELEPEDVGRLATQAIELIGTDELWEVGAAVPIRAVLDATKHLDGPIFSGSGADVLFAGGLNLQSPLSSTTAAEELRIRIWQNLNSSFRYDRLVPDFFERLLQVDAARFYEVFQTLEAWELTADFGPEVLFAHDGIGGTIDKICLRDLAVQLGVDPAFVWAKKNPLQFSSGIVASFACRAREYLAADLAQATYTDPITEAAESVIARMWLKQLRVQ